MTERVFLCEVDTIFFRNASQRRQKSARAGGTLVRKGPRRSPYQSKEWAVGALVGRVSYYFLTFMWASRDGRIVPVKQSSTFLIRIIDQSWGCCYQVPGNKLLGRGTAGSDPAERGSGEKRLTDWRSALGFCGGHSQN
jgi:hypothetical protein